MPMTPTVYLVKKFGWMQAKQQEVRHVALTRSILISPLEIAMSSHSVTSIYSRTTGQLTLLKATAWRPFCLLLSQTYILGQQAVAALLTLKCSKNFCQEGLSSASVIAMEKRCNLMAVWALLHWNTADGGWSLMADVKASKAFPYSPFRKYTIPTSFDLEKLWGSDFAMPCATYTGFICSSQLREQAWRLTSLQHPCHILHQPTKVQGYRSALKNTIYVGCSERTC